MHDDRRPTAVPSVKPPNRRTTQGRPAAVRRALPVLTYHSIDTSGSPISIAPDEFRRHMRALAGSGWRTLTIAEALQGLAARSWPARSFLLTFDDGYASVIESAAPEIRTCGFMPIVFIVSGRIGSDNQWPGQPTWVPRAPLLDWPALRSLVEAGWVLGAHSRTHVRLTDLNAQDVEREMLESKRDLEDRCGVAVEAFAYPYGAATSEVQTIAQRHFRAAVGTRLAYVTPRSNPLHLERLDAYYLRGLPLMSRLDGPAAASYFAVRRAARALAFFVKGAETGTSRVNGDIQR